MSFGDPFLTLYETMVYFHNGHQQHITSIQQQCRQIKNLRDLHRLASDIHAFNESLHIHHTIEDKHLFPMIARKTDISHLEAQHTQLAKLLSELENAAKRLKQATALDEDNRYLVETSTLIDRVSSVVNEHERTEERIITPDNMKKWFTTSEMRQLLHL